MAGAIQRRVVPHLSPSPPSCSADLGVADPELPARPGPLIGNAEKALEALRNRWCAGVFRRCSTSRPVAALSAQLDATASTVSAGCRTNH